MNLNKFASRKFILAVITLLIASGLRYLTAIDSTGYVTIVLAVLASYNISNVWQTTASSTQSN